MLDLLGKSALRVMRDHSHKKFEKDYIQSIPSYMKDRVVELDYKPREKIQIRNDIYSLTIAANITKGVTTAVTPVELN